MLKSRNFRILVVVESGELNVTHLLIVFNILNCEMKNKLPTFI